LEIFIHWEPVVIALPFAISDLFVVHTTVVYGNVQISYGVKEGGRGLLKPSEYRHMGGGGWPNRYITFIMAKKAQFTVYFALFTVLCEGMRLVESVIWGRGPLNTSEYRRMGRGV